MALLDNGRLPRDILPPINRPDFDKPKPEKTDLYRFSTMPGLSLSTAPLGSPNTIYSGPPPPYSRTSSTTEPAPPFSGYFSPPLSSTRRSTRDEKDLMFAKTLPSLHEALGGDKPVPLSGPPSTAQHQGVPLTPTTTIGHSLSGPPNPFAPTAPPPPLNTSYPAPESMSVKTPVLANAASTQASHPQQPYLSSPHTASNNHRSSGGSFSSLSRPLNHSSSQFAPVPPPEPSVQNNQYREYSNQPPVSQPLQPATSNFDPVIKLDNTANPFTGFNPPTSYDDRVKRHLEGFDAELALNEVTEISMRTSDFSRSWSQRHHQCNRMNYFADSAPSIQDIEEVIRQQQRVFEHLTRLRDLVFVEQSALTEQRARNARSHYDEEYHNSHEEYKAGGFAGGDAKKRRGKAAPPGRCHSCNRAETPEWRRGPDGARTLCNACGLHYAKLTRKLGVGKVGTLTGSSLRPKGLDTRPTHL